MNKTGVINIEGVVTLPSEFVAKLKKELPTHKELHELADQNLWNPLGKKLNDLCYFTLHAKDVWDAFEKKDISKAKEVTRTMIVAQDLYADWWAWLLTIEHQREEERILRRFGVIRDNPDDKIPEAKQLEHGQKRKAKEVLKNVGKLKRAMDL